MWLLDTSKYKIPIVVFPVYYVSLCTSHGPLLVRSNFWHDLGHIVIAICNTIAFHKVSWHCSGPGGLTDRYISISCWISRCNPLLCHIRVLLTEWISIALLLPLFSSNVFSGQCHCCLFLLASSWGLKLLCSRKCNSNVDMHRCRQGLATCAYSFG